MITPTTAALARVRASASTHPSTVTSEPRYSTPTPRRRRAAAKARAPSSWRDPGGRPTTTDTLRGTPAAWNAAPSRRPIAALAACSPATLRRPSAQASPSAAAAGSSRSSTIASNDPEASISSRTASVSGAAFASAAATNRVISCVRWSAPAARRTGAGAGPATGATSSTPTSPELIARAASEAVQPEATSDRMATSTRIVASS